MHSPSNCYSILARDTFATVSELPRNSSRLQPIPSATADIVSATADIVSATADPMAGQYGYLPMGFSAELDRVVNAELAKCDGDGATVAIENILKALIVSGKAQGGVPLPPNWVGIWSGNRGGYGINAGDMNLHGCDVIRSGFSWNKASDVVAARLPEPPPAREVAFNDEVVALSEGLVPPLAKLFAISVGGANTNAFLRAIAGRCRAVEGCRYSDAEGRWDSARVFSADENLRTAATTGMKWTLLEPDVAERYPTLFAALQSVLNQRSATNTSEIEVMLSAHGAILENIKTVVASGVNGELDYPKIVAIATRNNPPSASYADVLVRAAERFGGGKGAPMLKFFASYMRAGVNDTENVRAIGGRFWQKLLDLKFPQRAKMPVVVWTTALAQNSCPRRHIVAGVCQMLGDAHLAKLTKAANFDRVQQADQIMFEMDGLVKKDAGGIRILGLYRIKLTLHLMGALGLYSSSGVPEFTETWEICKASL